METKEIAVTVILQLVKLVVPKMNFSREELVDMVFILGESQRNPLLASRIYSARYRNRRCPEPVSFRKLLERFCTTGSVMYKPPRMPRTVCTPENALSVSIAVVEDPHRSSKEIGDIVAIPPSSVRRILSQNKFHPFKMKLCQQLGGTDFERRTNFCQWALNNIHADPDFFKKVLFTDECTFHNTGLVNHHNFHYYDTVNPRFTRATDRQHRWSVNVWGGIIGDCLIGPFFFDGMLNGQLYENFLRNELNGLLEDVPLNVRAEMWLQHDGAPAHSARLVRILLDEAFPHRWIGRGGQVEWPPRSPDLNKDDFFLWGYIKQLVYRSPPTIADDMKRRIREAFASISLQTLRKCNDSFERRLQMCIDQNGQTFEKFL